MPTISVDITLLLDISKSMKQQDCQISESYIFEFFELSPRTIDDQFLLELRAALTNKRIKRNFAMDILAQVIKEKLLGKINSVTIVWFNNKVGVLEFGKERKRSITLSNKQDTVSAKVLSRAIHQVCKVSQGGTNLSIGLSKVASIRKTSKIILITDGVWNLGYHPATILISNNLNLSIIDVGKADKEKSKFLKELCTLSNGVYVYINDINRKSIKQVDLIENWILTS
ncbi:MAG: VWA domain-containing protein [Candidatus Odinarchaeota archaeon]|nr:VWA domain-containing protein [Candidatus Odinarchaeota archaeon]